MKTVRWAADARLDLDRIDDWYADRDPDFADRVGDNAVAAANFLTEFPLAGPSFKGKVRKWPVPSTDVRLFYRIHADAIEILRVRHAREDMDKMS